MSRGTAELYDGLLDADPWPAALRGVAAALGITRGKARMHLKRVFAKTGARRQADHARLLLACQV